MANLVSKQGLGDGRQPTTLIGAILGLILINHPYANLRRSWDQIAKVVGKPVSTIRCEDQ